MLDWQLFVDVAIPALMLFVGVWVDRWLESRPILLSYWGHVSSFTYQQGDGNTGVVNTHSVVIRNVGRRAATNVRLSHTILPDFNIWPRIQYHLEESTRFRPGHRDPYSSPKTRADHLLSLFSPDALSQTSTRVSGAMRVSRPRYLFCWNGNIQVGSISLHAVLMILGILTLAYGLFEIGSWIVEAISN